MTLLNPTKTSLNITPESDFAKEGERMAKWNLTISVLWCFTGKTLTDSREYCEEHQHWSTSCDCRTTQATGRMFTGTYRWVTAVFPTASPVCWGSALALLTLWPGCLRQEIEQKSCYAGIIQPHCHLTSSARLYEVWICQIGIRGTRHQTSHGHDIIFRRN